jgi:hypothetical protein
MEQPQGESARQRWPKAAGRESAALVSPALEVETRTYVTESRLAQGFPPRVTDPNALAAIQRSLRPPHEPNTVRVEARSATHPSGTHNDPVKKGA